MKKIFFIGATVLFIGGAFAFNVNNSMKTSTGCPICGSSQCAKAATMSCTSGTCNADCCTSGCCN